MSEMFDVQAAIKKAIKTEKDAFDFYRFSAEKMADEKAKKVFTILANEEKQHAQMFYNVYHGDDLPAFDDYMVQEPDTDSSWWKTLQQSLLSGFDERKALQLAMEQEDLLEKQLRKTAEQIGDEEIKAIYLANANSTHHHMELVEEEYRSMLGMAG